MPYNHLDKALLYGCLMNILKDYNQLNSLLQSMGVRFEDYSSMTFAQRNVLRNFRHFIDEL